MKAQLEYATRNQNPFREEPLCFTGTTPWKPWVFLNPHPLDGGTSAYTTGGNCYASCNWQDLGSTHSSNLLLHLGLASFKPISSQGPCGTHVQSWQTLFPGASKANGVYCGEKSPLGRHCSPNSCVSYSNE